MSDWYFAYGSNLSIEQMIERTGLILPGERRARIARLPGFRLAFNMRGDDGQVYANITHPGKGVLGVIYRCGPEALEKLDAYEIGYERRLVRVVTEDEETLDAVAYVVKPEFVTNEQKPSGEYLSRIVTGARQHGLPATYVREIEAIAAGVRSLGSAADT